MSVADSVMMASLASVAERVTVTLVGRMPVPNSSRSLAPAESLIVSWPSPLLKRKVSLPAPPASVSLPAPPAITSLPSKPVMVSLPPVAACTRSCALTSATDHAVPSPKRTASSPQNESLPSRLVTSRRSVPVVNVMARSTPPVPARARRASLAA